ncbi:MAG TPA: hypothetical protein VMB48_05450 [Steroidobacteraceae bacterium]|nr:hypothetical protein [Steroidobacteraceae bacterium]
MRACGPGESALLLLDVVDVLSARKVRYAVIGALAASIYGVVRASMDADLLLAAGVQDARSIEAALVAAGFHTELRRGDLSDPIPALLEVVDSFGNRVDLLLGLRGIEPQAFARARDVPFQGSVLKFVGLEDFVAMKAFAGGPVDLQDARRAVAAAGGSLDRELVRRLAGRYGPDAVKALEQLLAG